jgi:predicted nucleic acid-binding protein
MLRSDLSRWLPSLEAFRPGWILTAGSLIITTVLWIAARFPGEIPPGFWPWLGLSQLTVLWSLTLMAIAMLAVVRAHALEPVFGGLDRAVRFHRILGPSAILLLIAHVVFLALVEIERGTSIGNVFIPFWSESVRSIDIIVFYLLLLLGGLAYDHRMSYERWLSVHGLTGLIFLGGSAHAAMEPGTIADFEPLRMWIVIVILAGGAAWLWRVVVLELRIGADTPRRQRAVDRVQAAFPTSRLIAPLPPLFDHAGRLFRALHGDGSGLDDRLRPVNDLLIALTARQIGATVVTSNLDDFRQIARHLPGLRIVAPG